MTVSELIAKLQEMPGEARVTYWDGENGPTNVHRAVQDAYAALAWDPETELPEAIDPVVIT